MANYFRVIKPITGTDIYFSILINGSWQARDGSNYQNIITSQGVTRSVKVRYTSTTVPNNQRCIKLSECRFFKGTQDVSDIPSYVSGGYSGIVSYLESESSWTEVDWATFAADNAASDTQTLSYETIGQYTTSSTYPYCLVYPASESGFLITDVTYRTVTTSLSQCTCNISSGTQFADGTSVTATVTPSSGYELTTAPTMTGSSGTWTRSENSYTCTFTITSDTAITATATEIPTYYTVTYALNNATCDYSQTQVLAGSTITVAFTPTPGYELFSTPPTLATPSTTVQCTQQSTPSSYVVYGSITVNGNLTITAYGSIAPASVLFTDATSNMTVSPADTTLPYNQAVTITATPNAHHTVTTTPAVNGASMQLVSGVYTLTIYPRVDTTITGVATEDFYITVDYQLSGCTAVPSESTKYYDGDEITLGLTADEGLYFQSVPYVVYFTRWGTQVTEDCTPLDATEYPTRFAWYYDGSSRITGVVLKGVCQAIPLIEDFGMFNIYAPTLQNLTDIANMRYTFSEEHEYFFRDVDLGNYVLSLMKVYADLPTSTNAEIVLGGYRTGITCPTIRYPYVTVDCGHVSILEWHHSEADYTHTELKMFVPFYGFIDLDPKDYMGFVVYLSYEIELLTGKALVTITAGDKIVQTLTCKVAMDIPYMFTINRSMVGKIEYNEYLLMDKTPYIEQWTNIVLSTDNVRGRYDSYGHVSFFSGYQQFDIIIDNIVATLSEINEIKALCSKGVYL